MVQISRQMIRINRDAIVGSVSDVGQLNQPRLKPRPRAEREEGISDYNASSRITLQMFWQSAGPPRAPTRISSLRCIRTVGSG